MRLTEEQRLLRDTAREFARRELAPYAAERDREARFPAEAIAELGRLGFMGITVPESTAGRVPIISATRWSWRRSQPARARSRRS